MLRFFYNHRVKLGVCTYGKLNSSGLFWTMIKSKINSRKIPENVNENNSNRSNIFKNLNTNNSL